MYTFEDLDRRITEFSPQMVIAKEGRAETDTLLICSASDPEDLAYFEQTGETTEGGGLFFWIDKRTGEFSFSPIPFLPNGSYLFEGAQSA